MKTHQLKTWPLFFQSVWMEEKRFEVRKNDRNFEIGDILELREWDNMPGRYTGRSLKTQVRYILHGGQFGIESGYVCLSIGGIAKFRDGKMVFQ